VIATVAREVFALLQLGSIFSIVLSSRARRARRIEAPNAQAERVVVETST
jgi:hypothetical protein